MMLKDGHECKTYQDPGAFLEDFRPGEFAVILTDIMMPHINGFEVLHAIREQDPRVPVIAITAMSDAPQQKKIRDEGFSDVLYKPILDFADFRNRVYLHLKNRGT